MTAAHRASLARAKARLDTLDLYPEPVSLRRVRIVVAPWFFRIPGFRRYHGYALVRTILVRRPDPSDDLVTHELCHVWQMQQRPLHVVLELADAHLPGQPLRGGGALGDGRDEGDGATAPSSAASAATSHHARPETPSAS